LPTTPGRPLVEVAPDELDRDGDGDRAELIPVFADDGALRYVTHQVPGDLSLRNSARLAAYQRIDARLSWTPRGGRWEIYLDVINVLNRHVGDYRMLPFLPSVGVRRRF